MDSTVLHVAAVLAGVALGMVAAQGWGALAFRVARFPDTRWPLEVALGLATCTFLGGLLNLAGLAFAGSLDAILVAGAGLAIKHWIRERKIAPPVPWSRSDWLRRAPPWAALALLAAFVAATQVPPRAYNFHDDYLAYLAHPVRMIETGTLAGNPLSRLGRMTLGGQAFLQGFVVAHLPIPYVNGFDALFCFALCFAMIVFVPLRQEGGGIAAFLGGALLVAINPQYVNVSALYSATAMLILLIFLCGRQTAFSAIPGGSRRLIPFALACSTLVALKPTFLPSAVALILCLSVVNGVIQRSARAFASVSFKLVGMTSVFLLPWILLHSRHFLQRSGGLDHEGPVPSVPMLNPFDVSPVFYGQTTAHYSVLMAIVLIVALGFALAAITAPAARSAGGHLVSAALLSSVGTYLLFLASSNLLSAPPERMLRFFCPIALAAAPSAIVLAWTDLHSFAPSRWKGGVRPAVAILAAMGIGIFTPGLVDRFSQAREAGSVLAFRAVASSPAYLAYSDTVLSRTYRDRVAQFQALVPPGASMLAWIAAPFYLDFDRNSITDVDIEGLTNPWASIPAVNHVLWSYRGMAIRSTASCLDMARAGAESRAEGAACASLRERLGGLVASGQAKVIADDGEMALLYLAVPLSR